VGESLGLPTVELVVVDGTESSSTRRLSTVLVGSAVVLMLTIVCSEIVSSFCIDKWQLLRSYKCQWREDERPG